jgi:hypothetical protein
MTIKEEIDKLQDKLEQLELVYKERREALMREVSDLRKIENGVEGR